jgi:probable HAF family extracellular repeat protein
MADFPPETRARRTCRLITALIVACVGFPLFGSVGAGASPVAPRYEITDLGALGANSTATGVNNAGTAVGWAAVGVRQRAVRYQSGLVTDLGTLGGDDSYAQAVNSVGEVAGSASRPNQLHHAFRWNSTMTDLGTLGGSSDISNATDVNDLGDVVGGSYNVQGTYHAFRHSGGAMRDLGALGIQSGLSYASGTNNVGDVVGSSDVNGIGSPWHAFLLSGIYTNGTMADLGTLPGGTNSGANEVSDTGVIVGWSDKGAGSAHAFLTVFGGAMVDLGTLGGSTSEAFGVNADNVVVGAAETSSGAQHAFVHDGFTMKDLNALVPAASGWELTKAADISDSGYIVGEGLHNGVMRAFRLTPVPDVNISDAVVTEGNSGTRAMRFTVSLTQPVNRTVSVQYTTGNYTAAAPSDYVATSGTVVFSPLETSKQVSVLVKGDTLNEANEVFLVGLSNATNAMIGDGLAGGTITNDDPLPSLRINDATVVEGNSGTRTLAFSVVLSAPSGRNVSVHYTTGDFTATAPSDYAAKSGTLTFAAGQTAKTVSVTVNGDLLKEPNEVLLVGLSNAVNATIADGLGGGTITNDD